MTTQTKSQAKRNQAPVVAPLVETLPPVDDTQPSTDIIEDNAAGNNAGDNEPDNSPIVLPLTTNALSIADFFKSVKVTVYDASILVGGAPVEFSGDILNSLLELGFRRTLDTNAATEGCKANSAGMPAYIISHIQRLQRGYMSLSEEKKAQAKALAGGGNASTKGIGSFGRAQILGKMSDLADTETQLAAIEKLRAFPDDKWTNYLKAAIIKPESLASQAVAELSRLAKQEAEQAMKAAESEFGDLLI